MDAEIIKEALSSIVSKKIELYEEGTIENRENFNRLITWLLNQAFNHGIGVVYSNQSKKAPSISFNEYGRLVILNVGYSPQTEIPFHLAHEIGHVLDEVDAFYNSSVYNRVKGEDKANLFAIKLLHQYCIEKDYHFSSVYSFATAFGIPHKHFWLLEFL